MPSLEGAMAGGDHVGAYVGPVSGLGILNGLIPQQFKWNLEDQL